MTARREVEIRDRLPKTTGGVAARLFVELGQQGVGIRYSYLSSIIAPDCCFLVLETTNDERALEVVAAAA
jgi:hypothetical protein